MSDLKRVRYFGQSRLATSPFLVVGAFFLTAIVSGSVAALLSLLWSPAMDFVAIFPILVILAACVPSRIDVGTDGVLIGWLGAPRFVA
jgi:hypothetical protein